MDILQLAAAFGPQELPPLDLAAGLNVIKVPSRESAAAWSALIRDMLYGPDPGMSPRSAASRGRLECATPWGGVALARWTANAGEPLGAFSAVYTASGQPAAYLTGAGCGELLLGVPREAFDRWAVLRSPEPGDGQAAATALAELRGILEEDQGEAAMLSARAGQLEELLERHRAADRRQAALAAENAQLDFASIRDKVKTMEASRKAPPPKEKLTALQASLDVLEAQEDRVRQARQRADHAARALQAAQAAESAQRPDGPSPEEDPPPKFRLSLSGLGWALLVGLALAASAFAAGQSGSWAASAGTALALAVLAATAAAPYLRRRREWRARQAERAAQAAQEREAYAALQENTRRAQAASRSASDAWEAEEADYREALSQILTQVRSFRPFAKDLGDARRAIADGLLERRKLDQALAEEEAARRRWEELRQDAVYPLPPAVRRPEEGRAWLQTELDTVQERLRALQGRFSAALEGHAGDVYARLTRESYPPRDLTPERDGALYLAAGLAECAMLLPGGVPLVLEAALDELDGGAVTAALDCLTELSQTRQVLLLTDRDREASCLRRTHPDRFRFVKL